MRELSAETRLRIVKAAMGKREPRRDIADKFNVKLQLVLDLIKDFNKSKRCIMRKRSRELHRLK